MRLPFWRVSVVELLGTFALVYFGAGTVCVNQLTLPPDQQPAVTALLAQHPGLVGLALAQGFILAAVLAATMHVSGGFLNPAITLMLWVFGRMENVRAVWLIGAQLLGGALAGLCLRLTFDNTVLTAARLGTPHLNPLAYHEPSNWNSLLGGAGVEFVLTFFLVFAIFGAILKKEAWQQLDDASRAPRTGSDPSLQTVDARLAGLVAGLTLTACVLFGFPLTGAATNPARWLGPVLWEASLGTTPERSPFADMFVYIAGPILGALLAGLVYFRVMRPEQPMAALPAVMRGKK